MAKVRKDKKGRVLHKGESFKNKHQLYCYAYMDPFGKRRCIYDKDLGSLREKETKIQMDKLSGLGVYAVAKSDINYVFDRYIATKSELRSSTMTNYIYTYDHFVRDGFGKRKIAEVRYSDILLFYKSLLDTGLKIATVDNIHSLLHPVFQMAVRDNIIKSNPADGALGDIKKKTSGRPEPRHALTIEEERAFLDWIDKPEYERWKRLFTVMFGTGGRVGEIIGLRWKDVDFKNNSISINHNITYGPRHDKDFKCEYRVNKPKTAAGIRSVPLLDKVKEALLAEKESQAKEDNQCQVELDGMSGFIFCNRYGTLHNPASLNKEIKRIVDDHNAREEVMAARERREPLIIPRFSCHVTRHTFCTRLCESETNIKVIQTVMGHKDIRTTLEIYAEVSERKKQEVFEELNNSIVF